MNFVIYLEIDICLKKSVVCIYHYNYCIQIHIMFIHIYRDNCLVKLKCCTKCNKEKHIYYIFKWKQLLIFIENLQNNTRRNQIKLYQLELMVTGMT